MQAESAGEPLLKKRPPPRSNHVIYCKRPIKVRCVHCKQEGPTIVNFQFDCITWFFFVLMMT